MHPGLTGNVCDVGDDNCCLEGPALMETRLVVDVIW
jgi:hypothetical protein